MIDEARLSEMLHAAAELHEPPPQGPAAVLAAAAGAPAASGRRRPRRTALVTVQIGIVVGVLVALVTGLGLLTHGTSSSSAHRFSSVGRNLGGSGSPARAAPGAGGSLGPGASGAAAGSGGGPGAGPAAEASPAAPPNVVPILGPKVVKTGSLDLEVRRGAFGPTVIQLETLASANRGFVAAAKTTESSSSPSGSVTLRVPVDRFDEVLKQARALGDVRAATTSGEDVTAQYTDLDARIHALSATRDQFLTLLGRASSIGDILAVEDRLSQLQMQIEQLQGQQKVLDDQSSYGTLTVSVAEPGQPVVGSTPPSRTGLAKAWHDAVSGFVDGAEGILGASGTLLLVALVLVALGLAARAIWSTFRRRLV